MAFCINCGQELAEDAKFCANCGTAVNRANIDAQRKTVYDGELHKCPSCGEVLNSFVSVCPTCGHELRGVKTSDSVHEFASKLEMAQSEEQRITLIRNFPIPNSKEDIFEFMILASTNITGEQNKIELDAWLVKFEQSYLKAKLILKDSPDMDRINAIYEQTHKQISKKKLIRNAKAAGNTLSKSKPLWGGILLLIGKSVVVIAGIILFMFAISINKSGGNSSMHELIGVILLVASAATLTKRKASYLEILIGAASGVLSLYFAKFLDNGSLLELGGVVVLIVVAFGFFKKIAKDEKN